jgi:trehalose-6-phosphatase
MAQGKGHRLPAGGGGTTPVRRRLPAIFIGDDRTDEDAFDVVRDLGGGIVVGDPPPPDTRAVAWLRGPEEVAALLRELADAD